MEKRSSTLNVLLTRKANRDLKEIWQWNVQEFGEEHANRYLDFLLLHSMKLIVGEGRAVLGQNNLRYKIIRRNSSGHGHIAVYRVSESAADLVRFFHTAQDWRNYFEKNEESP